MLCATPCVIEMNGYLNVAAKNASLVQAVVAHGSYAHADYRRDDTFIETRQQRQTTHQSHKTNAENNQQQQRTTERKEREGRGRQGKKEEERGRKERKGEERRRK